MRQCPRCYTPNTDESQYCASCGTSLQQGETSRATSMPSQEAYSYYSAAPVQYPVPEVSYPPTIPVYEQNYNIGGYSSDPRHPENERKRSGIGLFFSILLYLFGGFLAAFGIASLLLPTTNNTLVGAGFIIGFLITLLVLIFVLILHRHSRVRRWVRVVLFIGLTILAGIATVVVFAALPGNSNPTSEQYIIMGIVCLIYGISTAVIAFL